MIQNYKWKLLFQLMIFIIIEWWKFVTIDFNDPVQCEISLNIFCLKSHKDKLRICSWILIQNYETKKKIKNFQGHWCHVGRKGRLCCRIRRCRQGICSIFERLWMPCHYLWGKIFFFIPCTVEVHFCAAPKKIPSKP